MILNCRPPLAKIHDEGGRRLQRKPREEYVLMMIGFSEGDPANVCT
jgi:hypothetical protein